MLVTAMARYNAINQMHRAQWGITSNHMAMSSMLRNLGSQNALAFGSNDYRALAAKETQMMMDLENNKLLYAFYSAWEKELAKQQKEEVARFFDTKA